MAAQSTRRTRALVLLFVVLVVSAWLCFRGGMAKQAVAESTQITNEQLAEYAAKEYELMYHHGAAADRCAQAGVVVKGYQQVRDDTNYQIWRRIEAADCTLAGVLR